MNPISEFRTRRTVEFADTDMAGIIHFSRYFVFMERAEHELWNALGTSVHSPAGDYPDVVAEPGATIGWPRLEATCTFRRPVRFEDEVEIVVRVAAKGNRSLSFAVEFLHAGQTVAEGRLVTCCCVLESGRPPRAIPIPSAIADRLEVSPALADATGDED